MSASTTVYALVTVDSYSEQAFKSLQWPRVEGEWMWCRGTQNISHLDLKHDERRRARISQGYKAGEFQPHYLIQFKYKSVAVTELHKRVTHK